MSLSDVLNGIPGKGLVEWPQVRMVIVGALILACMWGALEARFAIHDARPHLGVSDSLRVILERQNTVIANQEKMFIVIESLRDAVVSAHGPLPPGPRR